MLYHDIKYLNLISSRLRNFKQKTPALWNFSCPYCNDSAYNKLKARGYCFEAKDGLVYYCHNCGFSTSFHKVLEHIDASLLKEYALEKFSDKYSGNKPVNSVDVLVNRIDEVHFESIKKRKFSEIKLPTINDLPHDHVAKLYVMNRLIPAQYYDEIWYAGDFKAFLDDLTPGHNKPVPSGERRIVFAFSDIDGHVLQVSGRALDPSEIRYITVKVTEGKKVFGLHRLRVDKRIYITEGPIDSLFLPNALASADANLEGLANWLCNEYDNIDLDVVLVYDKEPRNKQLINMIRDVSKTKHKVCLLPDIFPGKDINEAILNGWNTERILRLIDAHTYSGIELAIELMNWRA